MRKFRTYGTGAIERALYLTLATGVLAGCADRPAPTESATRLQTSVESRDIESRYIVLFRDDVSNPAALAQSLLAAHGGRLGHVYQFALKGFAVANLPAAAVEALRRNPLVWSVERAQNLKLNDVQQLPLDGFSYQYSSLWALDRVEERSPVFDGLYEYFYRGSGVHVYIVDSGVRGGHDEWGYGRIGTSVTRVSWSSGASPTIDQIGHGTGVAGAAAGVTYGIAKDATIHSVRVQDGDGGWNPFCGSSVCEEDVIAGIDWVAGYHESPAVMNVSIGGIPGSFGIRNALEGAIAAGVITVKAAGNDNVDAYQDRANRARGLIVVGASERTDVRSVFCCAQASNFGSLLTLFAPGSSVRSADKDSDTDSDDWFGTSFAAPLTAGVAALILQQEPYATQLRVRDVLVRASTVGVLGGDLGTGSPNRFVYSKIQTSAYPPPPVYPTPPTISGPDFVRPYSNCLYSVAPGSVPEPHTYSWHLDGVLQTETSAFYRVPAGTTSFQVELQLVDGTGNSHWDNKYVSVSGSASECLDS